VFAFVIKEEQKYIKGTAIITAIIKPGSEEETYF
jgi:hypothetical protein